MRLNPSSSFAKELTTIPGGQVVKECIACGECTAKCSIASKANLHPRKIVQRILIGARENVLNSEQPWICNLCETCDSSCHFGVRLSEIFNAVRILAIREGKVPTNFKAS